MKKQVLVIHGHPDPDRSRLNYVLAGEYRQAAVRGGHEVREIYIAELGFPLLDSASEYNDQPPPALIGDCQDLVRWCNHLAIFFPLWMGGMPAKLKGFLEQLLRPDFAYRNVSGRFPEKLLKEKSARIVVTMGMPALAYRWYFRAHSLKNLERNILGFCGIGPVRVTLFGLIDSDYPKRQQTRMKKMRSLGEAAI